MTLNKYYVVCTGYTYTTYHPYEQLYYEELLYRPVYKRTYYITAKHKTSAINKATYELLIRENISDYYFDFDYLVKKVKSNHFKYTTKRKAKRRVK